MKEIKNNKESYSGLIEELKELKKKKFEYKISRNCDPYGSVEYMTKDNVVSAFAIIRQSIQNKKDAASELGLDPGKVKITKTYRGYTAEEWKADFLTRLEQIRVEQRIKKLEKSCPELLGILAEDEKKSIVLDKINKELEEEEDE